MQARIIVRLSPAHRELWDDLHQIDPRHRAERLRVLATLGLAACKQGQAPVRAETAPAPLSSSAPTVGVNNARRRGIRDRLKTSITETTSA